MGWTDDPKRFALAATMPMLMQAAPSIDVNPARSCLLYKCYKEVFHDYPNYPAQTIGDCVGHGYSRAVDMLQTIDAFLGGRDVTAVGRTSAEYIYGSSRVVANFLGSQDGSFGSAAARSTTQKGMIRYATIGGPYDGQRSKQWGLAGPPAAMNQAAAQWRLGTAVLLTDPHSMLAAIQAGKPCVICSRRGFTMTRDARGFCYFQGSWGHCMWVAGYRADIPGYLVVQSWGRNNPAGPLDLDQPDYSFWVRAADMALIIAEGDSFAVSNSPHFGPAKLPGSWQAA